MIIIGVTGNSGAGKSTISTIIRHNTRALLIDADQLAKELMAPRTDYYNEIVELFGRTVLCDKRSKKGRRVNPVALAETIFKDNEKREKLNKLTFKYVGQKTKELIMENKEKEFVVLDFPLLYEGGFDKICNYVIGVFSDDRTKIARLVVRDNLNEERIKRRLNVQVNEEELKTKVDFCIKNPEGKKYPDLIKDTLKIIHTIKNNEEEKKKA